MTEPVSPSGRFVIPTAVEEFLILKDNIFEMSRRRST